MKKLILLVLILSISVSVCAKKEDNSLVYAELGFPLSLWPYFSDDSITLRTLDLYFRPMIYNFTDVKGIYKDYSECLVEEVKPSDINWDNIPNLHLELKEAYWDDNRTKRITADDVIASFELLISEYVDTIYRFVVGAVDYISKSQDGRGVDVVFRYPTRKLLSAMIFFILPAEIIGDFEGYRDLINDNEYITKFSSGPFRVKEVNQDTEIVFVRNKGYPVQPSLREVRMKVVRDADTAINNLVNGKVDMIVDIPPSLATTRIGGKKGIESVHYIENRFYYIAFNYRKKKFQDPKFRLDILRALNRQELGRAFGAMVEEITGPFVPDSRWADDTIRPRKYDPTVDLSKYNVEATLLAMDLASFRNLASSIEVQLKDAGLKINTEFKKPDEFWKLLKSGNFDMALLEYVSAKSFAVLSPLLSCGGSQNFGRFNCDNTYMIPEVRDLLDRLEGSRAFELAPEVRMDLYKDLHRILHDTEPYIWLFTVQRSMFYNSDLDIPFVSPSRPFKTIEYWRWKR